MKKAFTLILLVLIVATACIPTCAYNEFNTTFDCTNHKYYVYVGNWNSTTHSGKVYVDHDVYTVGAIDEYNNHFKVYLNGSYTCSGQKWCTPGKNIPITCKAIKKNTDVKIEGRGNTYYNEYLHFKTIRVAGTYGWPQ